MEQTNTRQSRDRGDREEATMSEEEKYDNLIGEKVETGDFSLEDLTGEKLVEVASENWKDHWKGMPEFEQDKEHHQKIMVKFLTEKDMLEFGERIGVKVTPRTRGIWYPAPEGVRESYLYRWFEGEDE